MMKSKKSLFSAVLIKDDLKRFWPVSALMFCVYFLFYEIDLLIPVGEEGYVGIPPQFHLIADFAAINDPIHALLLCITAICCAVGVFSYLHNKEASVCAHAMPFQRKTIFASHALAGGILAAAPMTLCALTSILLCALQTAAGNKVIGAELSEQTAYVSLYMAWLGLSLVVLLFTYAVAVLAAVIAGTLFTHVLLAMFLNGIAPVTAYIVNRYLYEFWLGLTEIPVSARSLSPLSMIYCNNSFYLSWQMLLASFLAGAAVLVLSGWLYQKIKLEKEGESVVFRGFGEVVCALFAFIGMTIAGFAGQSFRYTDSKLVFIGFAFAGALLFYFVSQMILEKKLQIFTGALWKKFGIFTIAAALFCAFTVFDITGFQDRVPDADQVKTIDLDRALGMEVYGITSSDPQFTSLETIEAVTALHKVLTEEGLQPHKEIEVQELTIHYTLKNGRKMSRIYALDIPKNFKLTEAYQALYDTKEYRENAAECVLADSHTIKTATMAGNNPNDASFYIPEEDQKAFVKEFEAALKKDAMARNFLGELSWYETMYTTDVDLFNEWHIYLDTGTDDGDYVYFLRPDGKHVSEVFFKYLKYTGTGKNLSETVSLME